jgi:2-keto-4-pentenoate hydratase/2-oxohepta-3-ene-1,7-dioic acid hydratase in catechol pathway
VKFASYEIEGRCAYGLFDGDAVRPVSARFLAGHPALADALGAGALAAAAASAAAEPMLPLAGLSLLPPIPSPAHIVCVGMNYREHIREMGREPPRYPALFARFADSLVGAGRPLIRPRTSHRFDFEGELAVIIGRPARHVPRDRALDHVGGYTCFMDGSLRDYQDHTTQFTAGKNFWRSGAVGPWLVSADEIPDPSVLTLQTRVNGELMQRGELSDLCIDIPAMIEYLSGIMALQPGDIIATGTPSGVGAARKPPRWLAPGDTVEVDISGIGVLANTVEDESA